MAQRVAVLAALFRRARRPALVGKVFRAPAVPRRARRGRRRRAVSRRARRRRRRRAGHLAARARNPVRRRRIGRRRPGVPGTTRVPEPVRRRYGLRQSPRRLLEQSVAVVLNALQRVERRDRAVEHAQTRAAQPARGHRRLIFARRRAESGRVFLNKFWRGVSLSKARVRLLDPSDAGARRARVLVHRHVGARAGRLRLAVHNLRLDLERRRPPARGAVPVSSSKIRPTSNFIRICRQAVQDRTRALHATRHET